MRDQHRPKQDLIHELVGLRKQVADLKDSALARRRVEDALRESRDRFRRLLDAAPVGLAWLDPDGRLAVANDALARLLGFERAADLLLLADVAGALAAPDGEPDLVRLLRECGRLDAHDARLRHREAGVVRVSASGAVVQGSDGEPDGCLLVLVPAGVTTPRRSVPGYPARSPCPTPPDSAGR